MQIGMIGLGRVGMNMVRRLVKGGHRVLKMYSSVREAFPKEVDDSTWKEFALKLYYSPVEYAFLESYSQPLKEMVPQLEKNTRREEIESSISPFPNPL